MLHPSSLVSSFPGKKKRSQLNGGEIYFSNKKKCLKMSSCVDFWVVKALIHKKVPSFPQFLK